MATTDHRPVLIVIAGPNGSGKTSVTSKILHHEWLEETSVFETVMSASDKVEYILRAKQAGFFVRLFFVSTESPTINAKRVANRVLNGGHDVPIPKILSRYDKSIANCIAIAPYVDRLYVYDNSIEDAEARLLFRLTDGQLAKRYVEVLPNWASAILPL